MEVIFEYNGEEILHANVENVALAKGNKIQLEEKKYVIRDILNQMVSVKWIDEPLFKKVVFKVVVILEDE